MRRSTALMAQWSLASAEGERLRFEQCRGGYPGGDRADGPGLRVIGATGQETLTGKNLFAPRQCAVYEVTTQGGDKKNVNGVLISGAGEYYLSAKTGGTNVYIYTYILDEARAVLRTPITYFVMPTSVSRGAISVAEGESLLIYDAVDGTAVDSTISRMEMCGIQLERGSVPSAFEPYCGGIPAPNPDFSMPIRKVAAGTKVTVKNDEGGIFSEVTVPCDLYEGDVWWPATGRVERNTCLMTFDGTEDWKTSADLGNFSLAFSLQVSEASGYLRKYTGGGYAMSNYFPKTTTLPALDQREGKVLIGGVNGDWIGIGLTERFSGITASFKAWLREKYSAGDPVEFMFKLMDPTIEQYDPQPILVPSGEVNVTQAPEELSAVLAAVAQVKKPAESRVMMTWEERFRAYVAETMARSNGGSLGVVCDNWYRQTAQEQLGTYGSRFYRYEVSPSPAGEKIGANLGLICEPSTNVYAGQDDYAELPLFKPYDVNYTIDPATLEPVLHAVKGIWGEYQDAPVDSFCGVMQMTGWVKRTWGETYKTVEYRATEAEGYKPLPEAVRVDGSVRGYVIHAKYAAGLNADGKLSSVSGVQPATYRPGSAGSKGISHDGQIALWREWGDQYGGSSICDSAFLQLMLELKYATLANSDVMLGCRSYSNSYAAAVGETGVKRVIVTVAQGNAFVVGSRASVGSSNDRSKAACYEACDIATVTAIEDVTVDGEAYRAIVLDAPAAFDTVAGVTYITTQPWLTGSTDAVLGNDGSPSNNKSDKEPLKLQGIEVMLGVYEALGDVVLYEDDVSGYTVYANRLASEAASGSAGTDPVTLGVLEKEETTTWRYNAELSWEANDQEWYMLPTLFGASSTTGYRGAVCRDALATKGWREWLAFGTLGFGALAAFSCATLNLGARAAAWNVGARASGSGGNRGEYAGK